MRPIKFRAWDKKKKEMIKVSSVDSTSEGELSFVCGGNDIHGECKSCHKDMNDFRTLFDNYFLMQYIGLKDKRGKGKEIYEGDVINAIIVPATSVPTMGEVVFDAEHLCYGSKNLSGITPFYNLRDIKVIGNIYKNPELLNAKD